jgi:hypothetical protein
MRDMAEPLEESLRPSPEVADRLRAAGWTDARVDVSHWIDRLRQDGYSVSRTAEEILRSYGGLRLLRRSLGGLSYDDLDLNPEYWFDERDHVARIESILSSSLCPLGETSGAAMLGVLDDGRVISEFEGYIDLLGDDWRQALDHLVLGRGNTTVLARDYESVDQR